MCRLWTPETGGGSVLALFLVGSCVVPCQCSRVGVMVEDQSVPEGCQGLSPACCHVSVRVSGHTLFDRDLAVKSIRKEAGRDGGADQVQLERKQPREAAYPVGLTKAYRVARGVWLRGNEARMRVVGQKMKNVDSREHHIVVARRSL